MREIQELMIAYAHRHEIFNGVTLVFEDDASGEIQHFFGEMLFEFNSIDQLIDKLKND